MIAKTIVKRALVALAVLRGRYDVDISLASALSERDARLARMHTSLMHMAQQRDYWCNLWQQMGREFENTQNTLINEIDLLRQRLGSAAGAAPQDKWQEILRQGFHERYVAPPSHPVPGVRTDATAIPFPPPAPAPPAELGSETNG